DCFRQPEADDLARPGRLQRRQRHVVGGGLHAADYTPGGIHQGAVPVENDQPIAHRCPPFSRKVSSACSKASSSGACRSSCSPLSGWRKRSERACRHSRVIPRAASSVLTAGLPYLLSPTSGKPACCAWTRIWWVRPVPSVASTSW